MSDSTERASGRHPDQSATTVLLARLERISNELKDAPPTEFRAYCFLAEQTAWAALQLARAILFDTRSTHLPKSDSEVFGAWVKEEWLGLAESRRLKQFCELRNLSAQEPALLDEAGIRGSVSEGLPYLTLFITTAKRLMNR